MDVLSLVEQTARYIATPKADWSKLSELQHDLIRWLDNDDDGQS